MASTSAVAALLIPADRRGLRDVEDVELVVRDPPPLGDRQFRGADVHAAVQLHGVGVDDLAAEPLRQVQRQRALARAGWSDDGDRPASPAGPPRPPTGNRRRTARRGTARAPTATATGRGGRPAPDTPPGRR